MAFVAVVPAVGTGIAGIAGLGGSALAGLGGLASAIPAIGGVVAPALTGLGGAVGSLGAGLGGSLMGGGLGALTGGLGGAASSLLGSGAAAGGLGSGLLGMGSGLGGLYAGADKLLGGFLPNLGIGGTIAPAQGYLGGLFPGMQNSPMFGGTANPFATHGVMNFNPNNPFDVAQAQGLTQPTGGIGDVLGGLGKKAAAAQGLLGAIDATRTTTPTPQSIQHSVNLQRPAPGLQPNGGQAPQRTQGIYGNQGSQSPFLQNAGPARPNEQFMRPGAQDSLQRMFGSGPGGGVLR